jgi:hypothetical protein
LHAWGCIQQDQNTGRSGLIINPDLSVKFRGNYLRLLAALCE